MRSWFSLVALIGFVVGMLLFIWAEWYCVTKPGRVADWGFVIVFGLASIAAIASLTRRERWRAGSSFLLGAMLALMFAWPFIAVSTIRSLFQSFSQSASHQVK